MNVSFFGRNNGFHSLKSVTQQRKTVRMSGTLLSPSFRHFLAMNASGKFQAEINNALSFRKLGRYKQDVKRVLFHGFQVTDVIG